MSSSRCTGVTIIFLSVLFVGAVCGTCIYYMRPYEPKFRLTSLNLTGLNISPSSHEVGGNWDVRFEIHSKYFKLRYDDLESSIFYNGELLSRVITPAFYQSAHNRTVLDVHHWAFNALTGQCNAIVSNNTMKSHADLAGGSVGFDVRLMGGVHYDGMEQRLQVLCGVVPVTVFGDGRSGNFTGVPHKCKRNLDSVSSSPSDDD